MEAHIQLPENQSESISTEIVKKAAHLFRVHGTLMLENSFEPQLVRSLQTDFLEKYASKDRSVVEKTSLQVGLDRFMFTIKLQAPFLNPALYAAKRVFPVVQELLGSDCVIQSIGVVNAYPGAAAQHVHRDHPELYAEAGGLNAFLPPFALHVVVPLVDLDEQTGTTALWEGSHRIKTKAERDRWTREELNELKGACLPYPKLGDCYFMDFRLRHAGTANISDYPRPILYLVYSRRWFQDRKNYDLQSPLLISREAYDSIPEEFRPLFKNAQPA